MASSSRSCKYDVFLSFRGEDTRKTFVDHLNSALKQQLIRVYKDDETLLRGESIDQSLFEAIEESRVAVVVFSKNYVDSSWCLEELAHIMKCKYERDLIVMPIFYDVEPTEVRNQKRKFGEAFARQEAKNVTKAETWRKALFDLSNIAGWEPKNIADGHESRFIKIIVDTILDRLFALNTSVDEDLVGMRARFHTLETLLDIGSSGVGMVGIWGIGGSGKTTLAYSLYKKISKQFHGHCTIENVREKTSKYGLEKLQENILAALFKKEENIFGVEEGKDKIKNALCRRNVLLLLDDVDTLSQLEALAGDRNWFGSGSRIIITTRDEHLLRTHRVDHVYHVTLLSDDEAIRLFKRHAYNEEDPVEDYETLSSHVVSYACGLPLSLKVLGSFLYDKNKNEWLGALKKLKDIPNPKVMNILKTSYDGLEHYEKEIFLDIACFFRWWHMDDVLEILEACGYHPEIGIKVLIQKTLITIVDGRFDMHDLIQEMGHYIVRGEHPNNPENHSRLWRHEEIRDIPFRNEKTEYDNIEAIIIDDGYLGSMNIVSRDLCKTVSKMTKLRLLIVSLDNDNDNDNGENAVGATFLSNELRYIEWLSYPASPFPQSFQPTKLVVLKLDKSLQKELWKGYKHLPHLKVLDLRHMGKLLNTPDFDGQLTKLALYDCMELEEIHPSLGNHTSLEYFKASYCHKLKRLPMMGRLKNINTLLIIWCYLKDGEIPCGIGEMSNLQELNLSGNSFSRLDFSLSQLTRLKSLNVSFCDNFLELPELPTSLAILTAHECKSLTIIEDFNKNCKQLCQVSLTDGWSDGLLQSMLTGNTIENGCMYLQLEGLDITKRFTPPLLKGSSCRMELPKNWCNDFSGFLICFVFSTDSYLIQPDIWISMNEVSGMNSEDDVVLGDSDDGYNYMTWVWYVPFVSLRHTIWWQQTHNAVSFSMDSLLVGDMRNYCNGFGVTLVVSKSRSGLMETSTTNSSHYAPKIEFRNDSASALTMSLIPYE